jgi:hypothetical protein
MNITQQEADDLINMKKVKLNDMNWKYPELGGSISIPLQSENKREDFILDISRGRIDLKKGTYQNRANKTVILIRLDFGGQPHTNPDGEEIPSPHLHLYREGYGDKWAMVLPIDKFSQISDLRQTLEDFMCYCNIIEYPIIEKGLFV